MKVLIASLFLTSLAFAKPPCSDYPGGQAAADAACSKVSEGTVCAGVGPRGNWVCKDPEGAIQGSIGGIGSTPVKIERDRQTSPSPGVVPGRQDRKR
jgi:L-aminopeptidase/D-esterase-like protein